MVEERQDREAQQKLVLGPNLQLLSPLARVQRDRKHQTDRLLRLATQRLQGAQDRRWITFLRPRLL